MTDAHARLDHAIDTLSQRFAGPGGAVAVLRDGHVLASRAWGWADAERRIPFTSRTMFRICSITKQFTCGLVLDACGDPDRLDEDVRRALPLLSTPPRARDLCHNQSGLRDYWALTTLCGSPVEAAFGPDEAARLIGRAASLQFAPGTRYSYANQNFRLLGDLVAARTGTDFGALLRQRIFDRAGMEHAALSADTTTIPGGTVGYEGSPAAGFRPAVNRVEWTGDAGIAACLDDMIAWETFIDATRDDAEGLYGRLSAPTCFADGTPAHYGFGLARGTVAGRSVTSHAGGLRGWRSYRMHCAAERVSVVVLFNHMADPHEAAVGLFTALLDEAPPATIGREVDPAWTGAFIEPQTGLAVRLEPAGSRVRLHYGTAAELVDPAAPDDGEATRLIRGDDGIWMVRPGENQRSRLRPIATTAAAPSGIEGEFHNAELGSRLTVLDAGGVLSGAFGGDLGTGEMQPMRSLGEDVWQLACPRALDYHAPGDWTLAFRRDGAGRITGVQVGCALARGLDYAALG